MKYKHVPVMLKEVLDFLQPRKGKNFIDCTLGGGGYTKEIAKKAGSKGRVIAIDMDEMAINNFKEQISKDKFKNIILIHENYKNLHKIIKENSLGREIKNFDGIVFDLGLSSAQLEDRTRGFSFQLDAPLDMAFGHKTRKERIDPKKTNYNTEFIINKHKEKELERILREYGEERYAKRIAESIVSERKNAKIETTKQLVEIIKNAVPAVYRNGKIHFATRTFQALRIATNQELENLEKVLPDAVDLLHSGGRIAVISYHSLEDRIVKRYFKKESSECICSKDVPVCRCGHIARLKIINKKVVIPSAEEIKLNSRARSAKMRVAEKK